MKNLGWFDKLVFFLNSLFAAALLFSYLLPYIPPDSFALLSVLSLGVPLLIIANFLFLIYWVLRFKRQFLLPFIVLLLGFNHVTSIYEFSGSEVEEISEDDLVLITYNVRQFNQFGFDKQKNVPEKISAFIRDQDPDVISMQEYFSGELTIAESFPHKYIKMKNKSAEFGLAIFSKYPIINSGSLDFNTASNNNGVFADIAIKGDTVRVINVHLQSFSMKPNLGNLEKEHSKKVFLGMGKTFVRQQEQMELVLETMKSSPYRVIVMGDFNNTAYSYIYRKLTSEGLDDAYKEDGNGFGRTFDFDYFPLRIDYILVDESLEVISFEAFEIHYSDHFPIRATIQFN